jgi:DNA polymerase III delta prime subunit
MDGLSSAVHIIFIIDTSIKVIKWCYDYADEFKHYKKERERLLRAVSGLKLVAEKVKQIIKTPRGERLKASRELQNTTGDGNKFLKNLEDKLCKSGKVNRFLLPLKKQGVEEDIQAIEKCTQIIHLVLQIDIA